MKNQIISIVGAGPAGVTAAIQLKRFGHNVLLFEKDRIGGLLRNANRIDNYIGFPTGISGKKIVKLFEKHLQRFSIYPIVSEITSIVYKDNVFQLNSDNSVYFSDYCIIATGTEPSEPQNIEIEDVAKQQCFYDLKNIDNIKKKHIGIIGSGDAAFDYAANLAEMNSIEILSRSENYKAIEVLAKETLQSKNVSFINNIEPIKIVKSSAKLSVICNTLDCQIEKNYDLIIFATGRHPAIPKINLVPIPNKLFIIGDANRAAAIRQFSIASGDAMNIAMQLHQLILNNGNENSSRNS